MPPLSQRLPPGLAPRGQTPRTWSGWGLSLVARTAYTLVFSTSRELTMGTEWLEQWCMAQRRPAILVCWHNSLLGLTRFAHWFLAKRGLTVCPMASRHRDGDLITRVMEDLDRSVRVVRGSTKRGGRQAFEELAHALACGLTAALTVDGPRGPCYEAKPGAVKLASELGVPIVPYSFATSREIRLRSAWDEFRIPLPFNTIRNVIGPPLWVPPDLPDHALWFWSARLDARLMALRAITERLTRGARYLGHPRSRPPTPTAIRHS